jgi:hypothetical protein
MFSLGYPRFIFFIVATSATREMTGRLSLTKTWQMDP